MNAAAHGSIVGRMSAVAWSVGVGLGATLLLAGCSDDAASGAAAAPEVTVVTVTPRTIPQPRSFVAQTASSRQVEIVARVNGFLDKIAYREGELVKSGQLLFELDRRPFEAQRDGAQGELLAQRARFTNAKATLDRVKPLASQNALSQADLDRATGEYEAASAAVFAAEAKLKQANLNLSYATIHSPVTGYASRASQREGAFINSMTDSANLTYVAAVDPIWVNLSVSQNLASKWGDEATKKQVIPPANQAYEIEIKLPDGTMFPQTGRINFAEPAFSQDTGSFLVRAELPNPQHVLRPGMFVTAIAKGAMRPNAIVVPQLAVQRGSQGHMVYVVTQEGLVEVRPVIVGDYYGDEEIVVVSGLHAGDRVVVTGALKVMPGKPVKIVEAAAKAEAKQ